MSKDEVAITILFPAAAEAVWNAWTDPALLLQWIGSDPEGKGGSANVDLRPGGHYEVTFQNSDGSEYTFFGTYVNVVPFSKLSFSWTWRNEPGVESFVALSFTPVGTSTRMHFQHKGLGNESEHQYQAGWERTFLKLEQVLA